MKNFKTILLSFKTILLSICIIIEILAIVLYIKDEISTKTFFLIVMSQSLVIGLYFMNKQKTKDK